MYFPYLRGKQFELIALKELVDLMKKKRSKISPIIEPVKKSTSLAKTLKCLCDNNINFTIIVNPEVGEMSGKHDDILSYINPVVAGYQNFQIGIIINHERRIKHSSLIKTLSKYNGIAKGLNLIHVATLESIKDIVESYNAVIPVIYNTVHFGKTSRRYHRNFDASTVVELDDYFSIQPKNKDYKKVSESNFSEEHLYYLSEGYRGFSDFLTIGDSYSDSGFLPYAIAIHLSYPDDSKTIKIRHFVSDSNDDYYDIGGKFAEAVAHLIKWCDENDFDSNAVQQFREFHNSGHFPGLGTIKKLSIENHIEVVLKLI